LRFEIDEEINFANSGDGISSTNIHSNISHDYEAELVQQARENK